MKMLLNGRSPDGRQSSKRSGSESGRYVAVAVALLVLVGLLYGGAWWLTRAERARPTVTAIGTVLPTAPSTAIAAVPPSATSTPVRARPTTWAVTEMTDPQTGRTYYMAPPEIVEMALQDCRDIDRFLQDEGSITSDQLDKYLLEPELSIVRKALSDERANGESRSRSSEATDLRVIEFSADGLMAKVAEDFHGETYPVYAYGTDRVLREERAPIGTGVTTMAYVPADGRWKASESEFIFGSPTTR